MEEYLSGRQIGQWIYSMQWTGRIRRLQSPEFTRRLPQIQGGFIKFMIDMPDTGKKKHLFTESTDKNPIVSNQCPCCKQDTKTTLHLYT